MKAVFCRLSLFPMWKMRFYPILSTKSTHIPTRW